MAPAALLAAPGALAAPRRAGGGAAGRRRSRTPWSGRAGGAQRWECQCQRRIDRLQGRGLGQVSGGQPCLQCSERPKFSRGLRAREGLLKPAALLDRGAAGQAQRSRGGARHSDNGLGALAPERLEVYRIKLPPGRTGRGIAAGARCCLVSSAGVQPVCGRREGAGLVRQGSPPSV